MKKIHVKRDDTVIVISGSSKGVIGKALAVSPDEGKVIVEGAHIVKKHQKPRRQGETGGIVEVPAAMYASKVQIVCGNSKCDKYNKGTRIKHVIDENGNKIRVCAKCGKEL
jgi:large subunit ribosomal protein L24